MKRLILIVMMVLMSSSITLAQDICESDFDCNGAVDAEDTSTFLLDFGRTVFCGGNFLCISCTNETPCPSDFNCDRNVDAIDMIIFLDDFGRNQFNNPCPPCVAGDWCDYDIVRCMEECDSELAMCLLACEEWPPDSRYICNDNCVFDYQYNCMPACG